jgi:hypothetical protein
LGAVLLTGLTVAVHATPVQYDFTGGYITLVVTYGSNGQIVQPTDIPLSGSEVTFDATANQLTNFEFTTTGSTTIALSGMIGSQSLAGESVTLSNLIATPGAGYTSSAMNFSGGVYSFTASTVNAVGQYALSGSLWTVGTTSFNVNSPSLTGQLQVSGDQFALNGITIATQTVGSGAFAQTVDLKADVVFTGAPVPLPPAIALFGSGLGLLGLLRLRRRHAP